MRRIDREWGLCVGAFACQWLWQAVLLFWVRCAVGARTPHNLAHNFEVAWANCCVASHLQEQAVVHEAMAVPKCVEFSALTAVV